MEHLTLANRHIGQQHYNKRVDYALVLLIMFVSGNPAFYKQSWYIAGIVVVAGALFLMFSKDLSKLFFNKFFTYVSVFLLIFLLQYINLGFLSFNTIFGFLLRVFIGGVIFYKLRERFSAAFFNVMFYASLLSFPFYLLHFIGGENVLPFTLVDSPRSVFFYTFRPQVFEPILRNSGMFWEPGAFQGYINLCLFMNLRRMQFIIRHQRYRLVILVLALLTTQSTTGFLTFGFVVGAYLLIYSKIGKVKLTFFITVFSLLSIFAYNNLTFLGEKITSQFNEALQADGEFDSRRIGALLFDWHYIKKNPITGNGFNEETRYVDHPHLIQAVKSGENLGLGNGFSSFVASAGIGGMFWFLYLIVRNQRSDLKKDAVLLCVLVIILLQGEPFLNFPFFLALPLFTLYSSKMRHGASSIVSNPNVS